MPFVTLFVLLTLALASFPALVHAEPPSFDCLQAQTAVERLICHDSELARFDRRLAEAYGARRSGLDEAGRAALRAEQQAWLRKRGESCGLGASRELPQDEAAWAAAPCLATMYRTRLAELGAAEPAPATALEPAAIHPLCLRDVLGRTDAEGEPRAADRAACEAGHAHVPVRVTVTGLVMADGLDTGVATFLGYREVGRFSDGELLLLVIENTGGSGMFSSLERVRLGVDGVRLVRGYGGGDRCNGGLRGGRLEGDEIVLESYLTSADLMAAGGQGEAFRAYDELEASASGCIGFAASTVTEEGEAGRLLSVTIEQAVEGWEGGPSRQACFNEALREAYPSLPVMLDPEATKVLAGTIVARCKG